MDFECVLDQYIALACDPGCAPHRFVLIDGRSQEALSAADLLPEAPLSEAHRRAVGVLIRTKQRTYRSAARNLAFLANSRAAGARMRAALLSPLAHPTPGGPATDIIARMEDEISRDRQKRGL